MKCAFKPYEGEDNYIFISYSHADSDNVAPILEKLNGEGFRVWYDEGIEWGTEWPESIASHLRACNVFIAFLSEKYVVSSNCRQEINYALKMKKDILSVYLEEIELTDGLDMQLSPYQSTFPFQYENIDDFYARLLETSVLQTCRNSNACSQEKADNDDSDKIKHRKRSIAKTDEKKRRNLRVPKVVVLGIILLALIGACVGVFFGKGFDASKKSNSSVFQVEQDVDDHILIKLSNANHQYEVGLENWKRLDYNRAERDILEARNEISETKSQAETDTAKVNNSVGCLYLDMGRYEEAYDYLNNAYITFRDKFGKDDRITSAVQFSIAQYDYFTGDVETSLKTIQEIVDKKIRKKTK